MRPFAAKVELLSAGGGDLRYVHGPLAEQIVVGGHREREWWRPVKLIERASSHL